VHVLSKGKIVKTGDKELAKELEANGYTDIIAEAAA
jgi:Fe-S cluster assembly ATP-binding protein